MVNYVIREKVIEDGGGGERQDCRISKGFIEGRHRIWGSP